MIPTIKVAIAISFINTALIILLVSFSSTLVSPARTSPPLTQISTATLVSSPPTPTSTSSIPYPSPTVIPVSPTPDTRCLVQVRGQVFDLTQFRNLHSGGDIFQCGSDMTAVFNSQHNDLTFENLQRYRI